MSGDFADALAEVVRTLRHTADLIDADAEFPSLTIDPDARDGYRHACLDLADGIERRTIAGGVLGQVDERGPVARDLSEWTRWLELHQRVFALKNVGPARARILQALIEAYPDAIEKSALAEQIGVSPTSGGYFNNLGSLRTLGLVDYPQRGYVAAEPILFLGGGA